MADPPAEVTELDYSTCATLPYGSKLTPSKLISNEIGKNPGKAYFINNKTVYYSCWIIRTCTFFSIVLVLVPINLNEKNILLLV